MKIATMVFLTGCCLAGRAAASDVDRLLGLCSGSKWPDVCEQTQKSFPADWRAANDGDYQGQRNVAYCLSTGCDGAVAVDRSAGCAWRMVILGSGAAVDSTDIMNYRFECRNEGADALAMARLLFRRIYSRSLPPLQ